MILGDTAKERGERLLGFMCPATTVALQAAARAEGISWDAVRRAADGLGVIRERRGPGAWIWRFPNQPDPEPEDVDADLSELLQAAMRERFAGLREPHVDAGPPADTPVGDDTGEALPGVESDAERPVDTDDGGIYTHPAADAGYIPLDEPSREGIPAGPDVALEPGERTAQCSRCALAVVTATPPDVLPRCAKCRTVPKPRLAPAAPWESDDSAAPWQSNGPDLMDSWRRNV